MLLCLIQMMFTVLLENGLQILSILKCTKMHKATSNALLNSLKLVEVARTLYYHYSVIDKVVHVSLASIYDHESNLHIRAPFSKLNRFLLFSFSQRTHPLLPTGSLLPLASSFNVPTSP